MRKFIFCLILLTCCPLRVLGQDFIPGTEDIPLMEGLAIDENETVIFDSPDGQIMTILAKTTANPKDINRFYDSSLSALGWEKVAESTYQRNQDTLTFSLSPEKNSTLIKFQITIPNN